MLKPGVLDAARARWAMENGLPSSMAGAIDPLGMGMPGVPGASQAAAAGLPAGALAMHATPPPSALPAPGARPTPPPVASDAPEVGVPEVPVTPKNAVDLEEKAQRADMTQKNLPMEYIEPIGPTDRMVSRVDRNLDKFWEFLKESQGALNDYQIAVLSGNPDAEKRFLQSIKEGGGQLWAQYKDFLKKKDEEGAKEDLAKALATSYRDQNLAPKPPGTAIEEEPNQTMRTIYPTGVSSAISARTGGEKVNVDELVPLGYSRMSEGGINEAAADIELERIRGRQHLKNAEVVDKTIEEWGAVDNRLKDFQNQVRSEKVAGLAKRDKAMRELIDMGDPDPYRMFRGVPGLFNGILTIFGGVVGGMNGAMRKDGINRFLENVDKWMADDFNAQVAVRKNKRDEMTELDRSYQNLRELFQDDTLAANTAKSMLYKQMELSLQKVLEKAGADMTDPLIKKVFGHWQKQDGKLGVDAGTYMDSIALQNAQQSNELLRARAAANADAAKFQIGNMMDAPTALKMMGEGLTDQITGTKDRVYIGDPEDRKKYIGLNAAYVLGHDVLEKFDTPQYREKGALTSARKELAAALAGLIPIFSAARKAGALDAGLVDNFNTSVSIEGLGNNWDNVLDAENIMRDLRNLVASARNEAIVLRATAGRRIPDAMIANKTMGLAPGPDLRRAGDWSVQGRAGKENPRGPSAKNTPAPAPDKKEKK